MEPIIKPIDVQTLKAELTPAKKLRDTNKGHNEIYILDHHDSPNVMLEIGRLREEAFRDSGGGSGLAADIDEFDTMEQPYRQLIVWDPDNEKILGGYRYIYGTDIKIDEKGQPVLATSHMFNFSEKFLKEYGLEVSLTETIGQAEHVFTHIRWKMQVYEGKVRDIDGFAAMRRPYIWASREQLEKEIMLPVAFSKIKW